jgi:hypothetical protein
LDSPLSHTGWRGFVRGIVRPASRRHEDHAMLPIIVAGTILTSPLTFRVIEPCASMLLSSASSTSLYPESLQRARVMHKLHLELRLGSTSLACWSTKPCATRLGECRSSLLANHATSFVGLRSVIVNTNRQGLCDP